MGWTERARAVGDQRWRELLELHDQAARRLIDQAGGRLIKSTGDDILAVLDGPGRGLRVVLALRAELRASEIEIRAGLHTGEVDLRSDDVEGSRSTSAPVSWPPPARARSWSPAPVRDLVVGSDIALQDRGTHTLKGIGDQWQLGAAR